MLTTVISVMSRDRVGIVADVAARIAGLGGDLADLSQTTLRGFFTLIVIASVPGRGSTSQTVRLELEQINARSGRGRQARDRVKEAADEPQPEPDAPSEEEYMLAVRGPDRVGLLADVTRICRDHDLNILDLSTRASEGQYVTLLLVDASRAHPLERVRRALEAEAPHAGSPSRSSTTTCSASTHEVGA